MTNYVNEYGLDELTGDFLSSVNYPNVHMSWSEWFEQAKAYGLTDEEITELEQYLEENNQLTFPIRFAGRQYWLTNREIQHAELIKQYYPNNWESEIESRMQKSNLGYLDRDWQLKARIQEN